MNYRNKVGVSLLFFGFAIALSLFLIPELAQAAICYFPDVDSTTDHAEDINWLAANGISEGFPDGTFRGCESVKRQDMAAFLRRLAILMGDESAAKEVQHRSTFVDVFENTPHADDIAWLEETGISNGYPDGSFRGMEPVCRQDMAAFLRRLAVLEQAGGSNSWEEVTDRFPDVKDGDDHAEDIGWLGHVGVAQGFPDGAFKGLQAVARQDMAAFLHRFSKLEKDGQNRGPSFLEWSARMVNALAKGDSSPDLGQMDLESCWAEALRLGIVPFEVADGHRIASRDFILCSAALTCSLSGDDSALDIQDVSDSSCPSLLSLAVQYGMGQLDHEGKIRPRAEVTNEDAEQVAHRVQELIAPNNQDSSEADWEVRDEVVVIREARCIGSGFRVFDADLSLEVGAKVLLLPEPSFPNGACGEVTSVVEQGDGYRLISIRQATRLRDIFRKVHLNLADSSLDFSTAQTGFMESLDADFEANAAGEIPIDVALKPLPGDAVKDGGSIKGALKVGCGLSADWNSDSDELFLNASISPSYSLDVDAHFDAMFQSRPISILPKEVSIPIGTTGASIELGVVLSPSCSGVFNLHSDGEANFGVRYQSNTLYGYQSGRMSPLKIEGSFSIPIQLESCFSFFGIDLVSAGPEVAPGAAGSMAVRPTGLVCSDIQFFMGIGLSARLDCLGDIAPTFEKGLLGPDDAPFKFSLHFENDSRVPQCSYKVALDNAAVCLFEDGRLVVSPDGSVEVSSGIVDRWVGFGNNTWRSKSVEHAEQIKSIEFKDGLMAPKTMRNLFKVDSNKFQVEEIDLRGLDTSQVVDMSLLFNSCHSLRTVHMDGVDMSEVKKADAMFRYCESLEQVNPDSSESKYRSELKAANLADLALPKMKSMEKAFMGCDSLTYIDVSGIDAPHVESMKESFAYCDKLREVNMTGMKTPELRVASGMFTNSGALEAVDLSGLITSSIEDMSDMFEFCYVLESVTLDECNLDSLKSANRMFHCCYKLKEIDFSVIEQKRMSQLKDMASMFEQCVSLSRVNFEGLQLPAVESMNSIFSLCWNLKTITLDGIDTQMLKDCSFMFHGCGELKSLDVADLDTAHVITMKNMFSGCGVGSLDVSNLRTDSCITMESMFDGCDNLTEIDLTDWDTSSVTNMVDMFAFCTKLDNPVISGLDTSAVENMSGMFEYCRNLTHFDFGSLDTSKVKNMSHMFDTCERLGAVEFGRADMGAVENTAFMFASCSSLKEVNLEGRNINAVRVAKGMFYFCKSLQIVHSIGVNLHEATDLSLLFMNCESLRNVEGIESWKVGSACKMEKAFECCPITPPSWYSGVSMAA